MKRARCIARIISLLACAPLSAFVHHPTADYKLIQVEGHSVYISPEAVADAALLNRVVTKLNSDLQMIHGLLQKAALAKLANVTFWIERDNPDVPGMTYHPSKEWLRQHGYNTDKAGCIEIGNLENFLSWHREQPFIVLHEMSHIYHAQVLGIEDATVKNAYAQAVASHRYDSVDYVNGGKKRAYALQNPTEYFAELSEAYWGKNDFYPFVRSDLETFDPVGFQMIERSWLGR